MWVALEFVFWAFLGVIGVAFEELLSWVGGGLQRLAGGSFGSDQSDRVWLAACALIGLGLVAYGMYLLMS